ncbi:MAG: efflux RND transporter periplasmic adaptor subunit [Terracidiphilus sp.]|nr:efflux RND transporter periplasmic adaptor subunit [Terracidiphilus sp.]
MSEIDDRSGSEHIGAEHQLSAPPSNSGKRWILWTTLLLIAVVVGYYFYHRQEAGHAAKPATGGSAGGSGGGRRGMTGPVPVTIATAAKGDIGVYLDALGTVTPVYTAAITPQASGVLTAVDYTEGQFVRKGDALIEIDPRPYQATLMQAEGALERDTSVLAQAEMDLERYRQAWARNSINKQLLEDQEKIVLADKGTVKNDQGTVDFDQAQLSYCHITAPISGQVGLRLVDPGNVVQAGGGNALVVITEMQPTTVIFTLAEDSLAQVQARMRQMHSLPVEAWDRTSTNKLGTGKLLTINNQIDTTTGTVKLRATFDNRNKALFPNQFVNTRLLVSTMTGVTLIPTGAVQHNGQVAFVYAIDAEKKVARVKNVKTGVSDAGVIAVTGINPGDQVATSSFEKLQDKSQVIISKQAMAANPSEGNTP